MKRMARLCVLILLAAHAALAQETTKPKSDTGPATMPPTVEQILDRYVTALGGQAALARLTSRVAKGTLEIPEMNVTGVFEQYMQSPNRSLTTVELASLGIRHQEGYDGSVAWASDATEGIREKRGGELAAARLDAEFHKEIKYRQLYPKLKLEGKEKIGAREVYLLLATPAEGGAEKHYFDAQTALLVRQDVARETPLGKMSIEMHLSDYREVDGVKIPFVVKQVSPLYELFFKTTEVKHNLVVDEARFKKPVR